MGKHDDDVVGAFESLRLRHLAFRRTEPEEMRELESMRLEVVKAESAVAPTSGVGGAVAALQLRLFERAYDILRLAQHANARENRGWMNLFREWGRDPAFHSYFTSKRHTISTECARFYDWYVHKQKSIEDHPIHHPWTRTEGDRGAGLFMDSGLTGPGGTATRERPGAGGVDDSKGLPGADLPYEGSGPDPKAGAPNE